MNAAAETLPTIWEAKQQANEENSTALRLRAEAAALEVIDGASYEVAGKLIQQIKRAKEALNTRRLSLTRPLDAVKKGIMDLFAPPIVVLEEGETIASGRMVTYRRAENERARAEQAKREDEARKERERLEKTARAQEKRGNEAAAEELRQKSQQTQAAQVMADVPKVAGVTVRKTYKCQVVDKLALIEAVAKGKAESALLDANMPALNGLARALKEGFAVPGCKLVIEEGVAGTGRGNDNE